MESSHFTFSIKEKRSYCHASNISHPVAAQASDSSAGHVLEETVKLCLRSQKMSLTLGVGFGITLIPVAAQSNAALHE